MTDDPGRVRVLRWVVPSPPAHLLRAEGYHVLPWARLAAAAAAARPGGTRRSLANPAAGLFARYTRHARLAVLGVPCGSVDDLRLLLGYVVEPAFGAGCTLLVGAERELASLEPRGFVDPQWRCPWTLERLRHLAARYAEPAVVPGPAPAPPWWRRFTPAVWRPVDTGPRPAPQLDPQQNAAVAAGDGVVQVIAPAGSGKTTVLVERVRELHRRGTPTRRILCSTFNRDACLEMAARLARAGLEGTVVRSFHGLGLDILKAEGRLRGGIGVLEPACWQELAARAAAAEPGCGPFDGAAAQHAVGTFKLALMITPEEAWRRAAALGPRPRAEARAYALCEAELRARHRLDFDDLIAGPVALLQQDARVRSRWQERFERVLVDEYQDIEPAQALLVGLLAAPQDSLFCVGDEDQCIYAWRRASVARVIDLDQTYPALERYPLVRNYRCGRAITGASRRLIAHNRQRFRKPLRSGVRNKGRIAVWPQADQEQGAALVARLAADAAPGQLAVLARTGGLLLAVAAAWQQLAGAGTTCPVDLLTVHGAKGREWDRVVLFGVDEGRFPLARALRPGDGGTRGAGLEDERRLFYVALTRARQQLDIVCSARSPSRFLQEAGIRVGRAPSWW